MAMASETKAVLLDAMWAGDSDLLQRLAPCGCCCEEHTLSACPARAWNGCRGQSAVEPSAEEWADFYEKSRRMTRSEFFFHGEVL